MAANVASRSSFVAAAAASTRASFATNSSRTSGEYSPPSSRVFSVSVTYKALASSVAALFRSACALSAATVCAHRALTRSSSRSSSRPRMSRPFVDAAFTSDSFNAVIFEHRASISSSADAIAVATRSSARLAPCATRARCASNLLRCVASVDALDRAFVSSRRPARGLCDRRVSSNSSRRSSISPATRRSARSRTSSRCRSASSSRASRAATSTGRRSDSARLSWGWTCGMGSGGGGGGGGQRRGGFDARSPRFVRWQSRGYNRRGIRVRRRRGFRRVQAAPRAPHSRRLQVRRSQRL
mmetsp:Transcript_2766/g.11844  ORF Transcript_2766/g.11844 Transcript_2766/m.11844 type:complete len:299 (-) Transcript_2766:1765-2661(-)